MSKSDSESTKKATEANGNRFAPAPIIIHSESSSFNAGIILDETNYDMWSQIMEMHLAEKEKLSFIRGNKQPPTEDDDGYEKWYGDNQKVKRWLLMAMTPDIMKRYIRLKSARDILKALSKAFYDGADELQVFTLNQRAFSAKQNGKSLSVYYGELTEIFSELDHRDKVIMECEKDVAAYHKNRSSQNGPSQKQQDRSRNNHPKVPMGSTKSNQKCTQCDQSGHIRERCFELIGYPEWWDHNRDPRKKYSNTTSVASVAETKTDMENVAETTSALVARRGHSNEADDWLWY
ncbi:unnamed protein product [Trifolium pratense]|uniref:Uncharacterized protein n=1 Tax=Trifolium pratense TaxID=57577 RepID=A0ACB0LAP8_TRIPR|nr:unnamed protein product [Trifolium pratense]